MLAGALAAGGGLAGPAAAGGAAVAGTVGGALARDRPASAPAPVPITVAVHPRVTPNRAGTPAHPQGVHLAVRVRFGIPLDYDPPLVRRIRVWFPRGALYEGGRYPTCPERVLVVTGPPGCPRDSIMGAGVGHATADRTHTSPRITVVNGGRRLAWFYVVLNNPAHVQEPLRGIVTPLHGRWAYRLSVAIPRNLQIVAGIPLVLHSLEIHAGRGNWLSSTSCPADHRWPWKAVGAFTSGQQITARGAVSCREPR